MLSKSFARRRSNREQVVDVSRIVLNGHCWFGAGKVFSIQRCQRATPRRPLFEERKLRAQHRRLDLIEAGVYTREGRGDLARTGHRSAAV